MITKIRFWENCAPSLRIHIIARYLFYTAQQKFRTKHNCLGVRSSQNELKICMLSPYSKAQLLGRFCYFLMKSPNFGTPYCKVYIHCTIYAIQHKVCNTQYTIHCTMYTVQCVQYTLYTNQKKLINCYLGL